MLGLAVCSKHDWIHSRLSTNNSNFSLYKLASPLIDKTVSGNINSYVLSMETLHISIHVLSRKSNPGRSNSNVVQLWDTNKYPALIVEMARKSPSQRRHSELISF